MLPVIFHPAAAAEAREAADWYESQQAGLSARFEEDVFATARRIQQNPLCDHRFIRSAYFRFRSAILQRDHSIHKSLHACS